MDQLILMMKLFNGVNVNLIVTGEKHQKLSLVKDKDDIIRTPKSKASTPKKVEKQVTIFFNDTCSFQTDFNIVPKIQKIYYFRILNLTGINQLTN